MEGERIESNSSAGFVSYWEKGESRIYRFTKTRRRIINGDESIGIIKRKAVRIEVLESSEKSYAIRWTYLSGTEDKGIPTASTDVEIFEDEMNQVSLTYLCNEIGEFQELVNEKEIKTVLNSIREKHLPEPKSVEEKAIIDQLFSEEKILNKFLQNIHLFHFPFGTEFTEEGYSVPIEIENPFDNKQNIPAEFRYQLLYFDPETEQGEIQIEKLLNQEKFKNILKEILTDLEGKLNEEDFDYASAFFNAKEKFNFEVDFNSGWIIEGKYEKSFMFHGEQAIETIEIVELEE